MQIIKVPNTKHRRIYWPQSLIDEGYVGDLKCYEGFSAIVIAKPGASAKNVAKTLELLMQDFKGRAQMEEES